MFPLCEYVCMYVNELMLVFLRKIDALRRTETLINASGGTAAAPLTVNAAGTSFNTGNICPHVQGPTEETCKEAEQTHVFIST